jgi:beta-lactamase class A
MRVSSLIAVAFGAQLSVLAPTPSPASAQAIDWSGMRSQLETRIAQHKGVVGVAVIDLAGGETLSIRGEERFPTAVVRGRPKDLDDLTYLGTED